MGKTIRCDTCNRSYRTLKAVEALRDNDGVCLECENPIEVEDWDEVVDSYDEEKAPAKKGAKKTAAAESTAKDEVKAEEGEEDEEEDEDEDDEDLEVGEEEEEEDELDLEEDEDEDDEDEEFDFGEEER
ncbi:MAG: hypothetical protein L0323_20430 [Planctomycetes bacterium]|nr:hypothetical protein [Planctomycetota bacterium]